MSFGRSVRAGKWIALMAVCMLGACSGHDSTPETPSESLLGTFLFSTEGPGDEDQERFEAALRSFDLITLPVFLRLVRPTENVEDFSLPDAVVDTAPPDAQFFVSGLVSNDLIPDWLQAADLDGADLRELLVDYVTSVLVHFEEKAPGRVLGYEIVLEPLSWTPPNGFWHRIGIDDGGDAMEYVRVAFRAARAAAPAAELYIDDFGVEGLDEKSQRYFELVTTLLDEGVPLDGVAVEGHFMLGGGGAFPEPPPFHNVVENLSRYRELGLKTMISSVDIALRDDAVTDAQLERQAKEYGQLMCACRVAGCVAFGTWGLGDADSWILQFFPGWGAPLLFDAHYAPKPAFAAVASARRDELCHQTKE